MSPFMDQINVLPHISEDQLPADHSSDASLLKNQLNNLPWDGISLSSLSVEHQLQIRPFCMSLLFANSLVSYVLKKKEIKGQPEINVEMFKERFENPFKERIGRLVLTYINALKSNETFADLESPAEFKSYSSKKQKVELLCSVLQRSFAYGFNQNMFATFLGLVFVFMLRDSQTVSSNTANKTVNYIADVLGVCMQTKFFNFYHFEVLEHFAYIPDETKPKKSLIELNLED